MTDHKCIDYAGNQPVNRNTETGIRYGVIPSTACNPDATEDVFQHGKDLDYEDYLNEAKIKLSHALADYFSNHAYDGKPSKLDQVVDDAFDAISDSLADNYEGTGDCTRMFYERDGCRLQIDGSGDLWVLESPYFTYAQFCSPCAPGACYLLNALETPDENNRAYCLWSDWFDDGKAPYVVYSVATGQIVNQ